MTLHKDDVLVGAVGLAVAALIVLALVEFVHEFRHPCIRYGEPYQRTVQTLIYTDGAGVYIWGPRTHTYRDCLERAP